MKKKQEPTKLETWYKNGHKKPVTRRDFLAMGALGSSAYVLAPSILQMFSSNLYAQGLVCPEVGSMASSMWPCIIIDMAGGGPMGQEFMVGGRGGQADLIPGSGGDNSTAYDNFGIPGALNYHLAGIVPDTTFGVKFHPNSALLQGIKNGLGGDLAAAAPSIDGGIIASAWNSDTSTNTGNPLHYFNVVGRYGKLIPNIGSNSSDSGGNTSPALNSVNAATKPVRVRTQNEASNIVNNARLNTLVGSAKSDKIRAAIEQMSSSKLAAFSGLAINQQIDELVKCGYIRASALPNLLNAATLFQDANLDSAFTATDTVERSISKLVFDGHVGAGTIALGGYDGHDNSATTMRNKFQNEVGPMVGKILRYAHLAQKPVFICMITDGSMGITAIDNTAANGANPGGGGFFGHPGDNDGVCTLAMLAYVPGKARGDIIENQGRQIGAFGASGVDRNYLITATNPTNCAQAMMFNYLTLQGKESEMGKIGTNGRNPFAGAQEFAYRIFKKAV